MNLISQTHKHVRHFFFKLTIIEMNDINDPKLKCSIIRIKCINFEVNRFSYNFGILLPSLYRQIVKLMKLILFILSCICIIFIQYFVNVAGMILFHEQKVFFVQVTMKTC